MRASCPNLAQRAPHQKNESDAESLCRKGVKGTGPDTWGLLAVDDGKDYRWEYKADRTYVSIWRAMGSCRTLALDYIERKSEP